MQYYNEKEKVCPQLITIFWLNLIEVIMFIALIISLFYINKTEGWEWFITTSFTSFVLLYFFSMIISLLIKKQLYVLPSEDYVKKFKLFSLIPIANFYLCWIIFIFVKQFKKDVKEIEQKAA
ncbi:MAG: hypothetical protein LBB39_01590 [Mycoplasmataceae bacterium]|jgi:hypothetical protein|nr:hypothetical protein [Mycoplasmataceae bacterium]